MQIPEPSVVVLVGPSGAGKSHWAAQHFKPGEIVSSDRLRSVVGEGEHDLDASKAAFELLDSIVAERVRRGLTTVIDTLGLDSGQRLAHLTLARRASMPALAVGFDTPPGICRRRNRDRRDPVPARALDGQLRAWREVRERLASEGWDQVVLVEPSALEMAIEPAAERAPVSATSRRTRGLDFALHVSSFDGWASDEMGSRLAEVAKRAEEVGFSAISVMDHLIQIPQVGRAWDPMLESYTTAAYLAGVTETVDLGVLVTAATFRNPAHLAKIVATLDVLSSGRAFCGLGAGWFETEHKAYGLPFGGLAERFDRLEDALQLLPMMWGPGATRFEGKTITVEEAVCYPRPIQSKIPILVGGMGERRTLRLVAEHADGCNLFGDAELVRKKVEVLRRHCADVGRDPAEVAVTHLAPALVGRDRQHVGELVEQIRPPRSSPSRYAKRVNAATLAQHVDRFHALAEAGVKRAFVPVPGLSEPGDLDVYADLISAFR